MFGYDSGIPRADMVRARPPLSPAPLLSQWSRACRLSCASPCARSAPPAPPVVCRGTAATYGIAVPIYGVNASISGISASNYRNSTAVSVNTASIHSLILNTHAHLFMVL
eukprot:1786807-Rhodomonas_salina.2